MTQGDAYDPVSDVDADGYRALVEYGGMRDAGHDIATTIAFRLASSPKHFSRAVGIPEDAAESMPEEERHAMLMRPFYSEESMASMLDAVGETSRSAATRASMHDMGVARYANFGTDSSFSSADDAADASRKLHRYRSYYV